MKDTSAFYRVTASLPQGALNNFEFPTSQGGTVTPLAGEGIATVGTGFMVGVTSPVLQFYRTADTTPLFIAADPASIVGYAA